MFWTFLIPPSAAVSSVRPNVSKAIAPDALRLEQARIDPKLIVLGADLRPTIQKLQIPIRKQGDRGTCSVFAMTFLLEFAYRSKLPAFRETFSPEFLNWAKNKAAKKSQDGDFFDVIDRGYTANGISTEVNCPYQPAFQPGFEPLPIALADGARYRGTFAGRFLKPWSYTPATEEQLDAIRASLKKGKPVATGFRWPKNGKFKTVKAGGTDVLDLVAEDDVFDGHSVVTVGYVPMKSAPGGGYFIVRNSWGESWGDAGYGYISFAYFQKFLNDAFVYE